MPKTTSRLDVRKTYKLYIGGKFPRSESGRYFPLNGPDGKTLIANVAFASRKDLRDAVTAATTAAPGWASANPVLRGQILYRSAEMLEARLSAFVEELCLQTGEAPAKARREVEKSIDRLVWYAGWADKFAQLFGCVNPVAAPFFNFTLPEPMGVVGLVAPNDAPLLAVVSKIAPAIVSGNAAVLIASERFPLSALSFGEVLATSDLPSGVVNILSGPRSELLPVLAKHMGVQGIDYSGRDAAEITLLQREGAANVKRVIVRPDPHGAAWWNESAAQSPYWIESLCEMKTAWHPIGV